MHYYLEASWGLLERFSTPRKCDWYRGELEVSFTEVWNMLPAFEPWGWKAIGPRSSFKSKNLWLYGWILYSPYYISNDSSVWVQFSIWIVWLFGAVWALSHVAVLLRTQAKLIAYVGRVWQEFSEYVFLKCTHTDTNTEKWPLFEWYVFGKHSHTFMNNEWVCVCVCVCTNTHTRTHTHFHTLSVFVCFTRT